MPETIEIKILISQTLAKEAESVGLLAPQTIESFLRAQIQKRRADRFSKPLSNSFKKVFLLLAMKRSRRKFKPCALKNESSIRDERSSLWIALGPRSSSG